MTSGGAPVPDAEVVVVASGDLDREAAREVAAETGDWLAVARALGTTTRTDARGEARIAAPPAGLLVVATRGAGFGQVESTSLPVEPIVVRLDERDVVAVDAGAPGVEVVLAVVTPAGPRDLPQVARSDADGVARLYLPCPGVPAGVLDGLELVARVRGSSRTSGAFPADAPPDETVRIDD